MERTLHVDIPTSIAEFESLMEVLAPRRFFYKILYRGRSLDFDRYRHYSPDEDASSIDWKASVRANTLLVRQYIEERNINVMFIIDMSEYMVFGSQEKLKCEYAVELTAALSHFIMKMGDNIGYILFNKTIFQFIPPGSGKTPFEMLIFELLQPNNYKGATNFFYILHEISTLLNPSIDFVVFVSDFLHIKKEYKQFFEEFGTLYETIALSVKDPLDVRLPSLNKEIVISNPFSSQKLLVNPRIAKSAYEQYVREQIFLTRALFEECDIDFLELYTHESFQPLLAQFLKTRAGKRG